MASFCCYNNSDRMSLQPWSWQISVYLIQLVVIFLNVCLWRHSLRSDLEGIDPEKLYLATFICQYALYCYKVWPSFFLVDECFVKIWATCDNFLGKWFTAPSGKKLPVRLCARVNVFSTTVVTEDTTLTPTWDQALFLFRLNRECMTAAKIGLISFSLNSNL